MTRKKQNKSSSKTIHYVQLRTHRQWTNQYNYLSHLGIFHSKIKPITYHIDTILNNKWINIRRPQLINQLHQIHQEDIQKKFDHQRNLINYKYFCLINQFDENNRFIRQIFIRSFEITDYLLDFDQQIQYGERQIYQYRLNILIYQFQQEKEALKHLFIDQEFKQFDNQINVLNAIEQQNNLQLFIQFQIQKRQLEENFFKDINILHGHFKTQIESLRSIINQKIASNKHKISITSKHCHTLYEKSRQGKERIDQEMISIDILKRKIKETKNVLDRIDTDRSDVNDKLNQLKECSNDHQNVFISRKSFLKNCQSNQSQIIFRRLSVLTDNAQKNLQKKLFKVERVLLLINQCQRLELEDEKLLFRTSKNDLNPMRNKILSEVHYLQNCHLEFDSFFDELSLFWKRFAHVQMDLFIRIQEKNSNKKLQHFFKNQLKILF